MARSTIFEKLASGWSISKEVERIQELIFERDTVKAFNHTRMTIARTVDYYLFDNWSKRGHCLDFDDFLDDMDYENLKERAKIDIESQLDFLELCYNLLYLVDLIIVKQPFDFTPLDDYNLARTIIDDCLARLNHKAYFNETDSTVRVIERDATVTAVVEIEETPEICSDIIQYNHHTLKGDISKKKSILLKLGNQLDGSRKMLTNIDKSLSSDIFTLLNNLNIRHNNITPETKDYRKVVENMHLEELEEWYDELYQMILLAKLELNNIERTKNVAALKAKLNLNEGAI